MTTTSKVEAFDKLAGGGDAGITKAITSVHKRASTVQMDIHNVLVAVAIRWAQTGDMRPVAGHVNHLLTKDQLGGMRKNAIKVWVETFLGMQLVDGDQDTFFVPADKKDGKHIMVKEAIANRWFSFTPEENYVPIADVSKLLNSLIAKCNKDRQKVGDKSMVSPELLTALEAAKGFAGTAVAQ